MDPGWRGHLKAGQSGQQGNSGGREVHLGLKRVPFLEKGTGSIKPKNLGEACGTGKGVGSQTLAVALGLNSCCKNPSSANSEIQTKTNLATSGGSCAQSFTVINENTEHWKSEL